MDAWREGDEFVVEFDLPGVSPDSVGLDAERDVVTVCDRCRSCGGREEDHRLKNATRYRMRVTAVLPEGQGVASLSARSTATHMSLTVKSLGDGADSRGRQYLAPGCRRRLPTAPSPRSVAPTATSCSRPGASASPQCVLCSKP